MHFREALIRFAGGMTFALCAAAMLIGMVALHGCAKEGDTHIALPSVQEQAAQAIAWCEDAARGSAEKVVCYPDHGNGPVKRLHLGHDGDKLNVCFRECVCFYGCPR